MTKYFNTLLIVQLFLVLSTVTFSQTPIYLDPIASIDDRIDDLLARMTLDEKVGQMTQADHECQLQLLVNSRT